MSLRQELLLAPKSPGTDIPFHDVLAHMIYFVTVVENLIPFRILKTVKRDKNKVKSC